MENPSWFGAHQQQEAQIHSASPKQHCAWAAQHLHYSSDTLPLPHVVLIHIGHLVIQRVLVCPALPHIPKSMDHEVRVFYVQLSY